MPFLFQNSNYKYSPERELACSLVSVAEKPYSLVSCFI